MKQRVSLVIFLLIAALLFIPGTQGETADIDLDKFNEIYELLDLYHLNELDDDALLEALDAIIRGLDDPYTGYMSEDEYNEFVERLNGSFGGVGIQITLQDGYLTVLTPLKDTPAERAGILAGDRIVGIDGLDVVGYSLEQAVQLIRGPEGTTVTLTIDRNGQRLDLPLVRELIVLEKVEYDLLEGNIGYLDIDTFGERTAKEVREAIIELQLRGADKWLIDLRSNGGGYLSVALEIANYFISEGALVHLVDRYGETVTYEATPGILVSNQEIVVLVDQYTASAAEILAGALQDHNLATIVGVNTFGKASVQSLIPLDNGGYLKVTTAQYLTPSGKQIQGVGLIPDKYVTGSQSQWDLALSLLLDRPIEQDMVFHLGRQEALINGRLYKLLEPPLVINGRAYIPLRDMSNILKLPLEWKDGEAHIDYYGKEVLVRPQTHNQDSRVLIDGEEVNFSLPIILERNRIFVPVRMLENMDATIYFDGSTGTIRIQK